jgi:hypothetical protein
MDRPRFTVDGFQKGPGGKQYRENWIDRFTVVGSNFPERAGRHWTISFTVWIPMFFPEHDR